MTTLLTTEHQWRERLLDAKALFQHRTVEAYVEFCQQVVAFRQFCVSARGGTNFTARGMEWLGCDKSTLSRFVAVGERADELLGATQLLPNSTDAVSRIAALPDDQFSTTLDRVDPNMTQAEVRDLIREVKGLPAPQKRRPVVIDVGPDNPVLERYLKGELERTKEQLEQRDKELERARVTIEALEKRPAATTVEATRSDERLQAALEGKDRIIASLQAERDVAIAEAAALRKQLEARTPLPKEGTFSAHDILEAA